jgi:hypothetical protein
VAVALPQLPLRPITRGAELIMDMLQPEVLGVPSTVIIRTTLIPFAAYGPDAFPSFALDTVAFLGLYHSASAMFHGSVHVDLAILGQWHHSSICTAMINTRLFLPAGRHRSLIPCDPPDAGETRRRRRLLLLVIRSRSTSFAVPRFFFRSSAHRAP